MCMKTYLLVFLIVLPSFLVSENRYSAVEHDFYFSYTNLYYKDTESSLQLSVKMFASDLELSLKNSFRDNIKLDSTTLSDAQIYSSIEKYMDRHLQLSVNGNQQCGKEFLGYEYDADLIWIYIEYPELNHISRIELKNTLLIESFASQQNIVNVQVNKERKTVLLNDRVTVASFQF